MIVQREDGSYLVDGLLPFIDLQEQLDLPSLEEQVRPRDFETVAGFVLALLGRIPSVIRRHRDHLQDACVGALA